MSPDQIAIHTFTTKPWTIDECIEHYAKSGVGGISIWRETIEGQDLVRVATHLRDSGLKPVSLVRGGFFTKSAELDDKQLIQRNLDAIAQAEALGLPMIVLVCGATIGQAPEENLEQIEAGIRALLPRCEETGIKLAIEPLHPMYAGDRSAVASLRDANILAQRINHPLVGVAIDTFHVWWETNLEDEIRDCAANGHLFAFHICEFKPDFSHPLLDRGLPGEGVNATPRILNMVRESGFTGLSEVEVFSTKYWKLDQHDFLKQVIDSTADL